MHSIKKILLLIIAFFSISNACQEFILPDEIWGLIVIDALIEKPSDAGNLAFVSKQLYTIIQIPHVIKTAVMNRKYPIITHYETARRMRLPAITTPYVNANEKLLTIIELTSYQETLKTNPYTDINYEGTKRKNRLEMICSDYPEYKLNWIEWLTQHGARENNTHAPKQTALGTVLKLYKEHSNCSSTKCARCYQLKNSYHTIIKVLLKNGGADPSLHIHEAIDARDAPTVQLLIDSGATIQKHDNEWFYYYLSEGNIDETALKFLLEQGYDPRAHGSRWISSEYDGPYVRQFPNAIEAVQKDTPSEKRDRILALLKQYSKKKSELAFVLGVL